MKKIFIKLDYNFINKLEWRSFEALCYYTFLFLGKNPEWNKGGKDGGIDIELYDKNQKRTAIVQCKAYKNKVGVAAIREFVGIRHENEVKGAIFVASNGFSDDAIATADKNNIILFTTEILLTFIYSKLSFAHQKEIYQRLTAANSETTPTCVRCGIKLVLRTTKKGKNKGKQFWGCPNFSLPDPDKCRFTMHSRKQYE